jgi:hypothetical protein
MPSWEAHRVNLECESMFMKMSYFNGGSGPGRQIFRCKLQQGLGESRNTEFGSESCQGRRYSRESLDEQWLRRRRISCNHSQQRFDEKRNSSLHTLRRSTRSRRRPLLTDGACCVSSDISERTCRSRAAYKGMGEPMGASLTWHCLEP